MSDAVASPLIFPDTWHRRHLLDLESLSGEELQTLLDVAQQMKDLTHGCRRKISILEGKTCANLFFENSTRTRNSFSLAAKRLGADTVEFGSSGSSVAKGETLIDTAKTIEAMGVDWVVTRHRTPGTPHLLARELKCPIVNAGDGPHEHPTQGLLDLLTIRQHRGTLQGLTVALVGDICAQPHGTQQHLVKDAGRSRDHLWTAHACQFALGGVGLRGRPSLGRNLAALRRFELVANSI